MKDFWETENHTFCQRQLRFSNQMSSRRKVRDKLPDIPESKTCSKFKSKNLNSSSWNFLAPNYNIFFFFSFITLIFYFSKYLTDLFEFGEIPSIFPFRAVWWINWNYIYIYIFLTVFIQEAQKWGLLFQSWCNFDW